MRLKVYSNGDLYYGQTKDSHMRGLGVLLRPGVSLYFGKVSDKQPKGAGCFVTQDQILF